MSVFEVKQGTSPVILGFPHTGTEVPAELTLLRPDAPVLMKPIQPMHVIAILAAHAERSGNKR